MLITITQKTRFDLDNSTVLEKRMNGGVRHRFDDRSSYMVYLCTEFELEEWLKLDDKNILHDHYEMI